MAQAMAPTIGGGPTPSHPPHGARDRLGPASFSAAQARVAPPSRAVPRPGDAVPGSRRGDWPAPKATASHPEAFVRRVDPIPLLFFVASLLLLAGMAMEIPAEPAGQASICRARAGDATATSVPAAS